MCANIVISREIRDTFRKNLIRIRQPAQSRKLLTTKKKANYKRVKLAGINCKSFIMKYMTTIITVLFLIIQTAIYSQSQKIDLIEQVSLGGIQQTILIRGDDTLNPILLILHGGPGFSEFIFFRTYNKELETKYTVVNWDQRGTGLSYSESIDPKTMTIDQLVSDAHELVQLLKHRYHQKKIVLLGHSWGTLLGIELAQRYPEDFFCYVGTGQFVSGVENERISFAYTLEKAESTKDQKAIRELTAMANVFPYSDSIPQSIAEQINNLKIQRRWLEIFGGVLHHGSNYRKLFKHVDNKEMALYNKSRAVKGEIFSTKNLWSQLLVVDLNKSITNVTVPVYFLVGKKDYNTPFTLTENYFHHLTAPKKQLIWFERSGHFTFFEEPRKFNDVLLHTIYKETESIH